MNTETHKHCPRCKEVKARSEFGQNVTTADGLAAYCFPCAREQRRETQEKYRERNLRRRAEAAAAAEKSAA
jgi:hypothetical protein